MMLMLRNQEVASTYRVQLAKHLVGAVRGGRRVRRQGSLGGPVRVRPAQTHASDVAQPLQRVPLTVACNWARRLSSIAQVTAGAFSSRVAPP